MVFTVLSWNCRGAKSKAFHLHLQELIRSFKPTVLALLETKINSNLSAPYICKSSSFNKFVCAEAIGFAGGIWLFWDDTVIDLEVIAVDDQIITVIVRTLYRVDCVLSVVYASPVYMLRSSLWEYLEALGSVMTAPWLLIGDWNQVLVPADKSGGRPVGSLMSNSLWQVVLRCALLDLGFTGSKYTWSNHRQGQGCIRERLDRAWCNSAWQLQHPHASVQHLYRSYSDHSPILLSTGDQPQRLRPPNSFLMLTAWFQHRDFHKLVNRVWVVPEIPLQQALGQFRELAQWWNRHCFGNIFERKRRCLARLAGVQRKLEEQPSRYRYLDSVESRLLAEFHDILNSEASFWKQRAKDRWLRGGERNSKYFHMTALLRQRKRTITQLKGNDGVWCHDSDLLAQWARDFYLQLYTAEVTLPCNPLLWTFPTLTHADRRWLNRAVFDGEIHMALFQIGPDKAAGPDGFIPRFFQQFWSIVGSSVCAYVANIFRTGRVCRDENKTFICPLPKVFSPETLSHFRPIALCNVLSKLVMKVLTNRLKPLMCKLTGPSQVSFVPGRQAMDNVIIAQELLHTYRRKRGCRGGLVLKVDLEKAYDRVDWPFLREVLLAAGFSSHLTLLILSCISSTSVPVLWNGSSLSEFQPQRGLRQGDPLSPYLFVLCMEVLGQRISRAVDEKEWKPLKASRSGPSISHLFFADDLLLFGTASMQQAQVMEMILAEFCGFSGQRVNRHKSHLWLSPNISRLLRGQLGTAFQVPITADLGVYLGVPFVHTRASASLYEPLVLKVRSRFAGWRMRLLSRASRALLVQTVASTIPTYLMQAAYLPQSVKERLERMSRSFLWGDRSDKRSMHYVSWKRVCLPKLHGGLGIRRLEHSNLVALARLCWRLVTSPDRLWSQVLLSKYSGLPDLQGFQSKGSPSHIWRAIRKGWSVVREGLQWQVGNGCLVRFWKDPWVAAVPLLSLCLHHPPEEWLDLPVCAFWVAGSGWLVSHLCGFLDAGTLRALQGISLQPDSSDEWVWQASTSGSFSSASAYRLLLPDVDRPHPNWRHIWAFKGPTRPSMTLWLLQHGRLPTADYLWRRNIVEHPACFICNAPHEDLLHVLRDCPRSRNVWTLLLHGCDVPAFWTATSVDEWLQLNLSINMERLTDHLHWRYIFRQCIHDLWTARNASLHRTAVWPGCYLFVKFLLTRVTDTLIVWYDVELE